jgi:hypothetical protein
MAGFLSSYNADPERPLGDTVDPKQSTLDERDVANKERELALREREVVAREKEVVAQEKDVAAKEKEFLRSRWTNPLVLGLFAAAFGLVGNIAVTFGNILVTKENNDNTQRIEHQHAQSALIFEAIKTKEPKDACRNLTFFRKLGFLDDAANAIGQACPGDNSGVPTLPTADTDTMPSSYVRIMIIDENGNAISDAEVHLRDREGNADNCITIETGMCVLPPLPYGDKIHLVIERAGYKTKKTDFVWAGGGIMRVMLEKK